MGEQQGKRPNAQSFLASQNLQGYGLPLYENGWSIFMELLLLDALQIFGPENWVMAASYINSSFSPEEVRDHYYRVYGDHSSTNQFKLIIGDTRKGMLIQNEEYDIYISARKREERLKRENREKMLEFNFCQGMKQKEQNSAELCCRIPQQFGYEVMKKTFAQPYNEQAEVLVVNLKINKDDDKQTRQNKMFVLKKYDQLVLERAIVENEVISKKLMDCKYKINFNDLNVLVNSKAQKKKPSAQGRNKGRNRKGLKQSQQNEATQHAYNQLFNSMKRTFDDELCEDLHLAYTKIKKYDEEGKLKKLLTEYQDRCNTLNGTQGDSGKEAHPGTHRQESDSEWESD